MIFRERIREAVVAVARKIVDGMKRAVRGG
jgi:hypothetical protein